VVGVTSAAEAVPQHLRLRGADAPLFHGAGAVRGCNVRNQDQSQRQRTELALSLPKGVSAPHEPSNSHVSQRTREMGHPAAVASDPLAII